LDPLPPDTADNPRRERVVFDLLAYDNGSAKSPSHYLSASSGL